MNRGLLLAEWRRALRSLAAAGLLAREGFAEDAVSRTYYAILHAAKAALLVHDVTVETMPHSAAGSASPWSGRAESNGSGQPNYASASKIGSTPTMTRSTLSPRKTLDRRLNGPRLSLRESAAICSTTG